ncbi:MAG: beta-ketoacyl-ACP synthase III [Alphaproteobacteria bacterium]
MTSQTPSRRYARFVATGAYLPERVVTNEELGKLVDTSDEWINARTGIRRRHMAADGEMTSDLATRAAEQALNNAGLDIADIDLIMVATATPDNTFPATATKVQANLGMTHGAAFDLAAVCSGFVYGLHMADALIGSGKATRILLIGAETFSRILDWEDRTTCVLFGDGAGAVILEANDVADGDTSPQGILASEIRSDGRHYDLLYVDGGPSATQTVGLLRMKGKEVFKHAVRNLAQVGTAVLDQTGMTAQDIDIVLPHQANKRIIDATVDKLKINPDNVMLTVQDHGNTSAASVPLALHRAVEEGKVKSGDIALFEAMGGGFTWGAVLARW